VPKDVGALKGSGGSEWDAGSASTLVLDVGHGSVVSPVDGGWCRGSVLTGLGLGDGGVGQISGESDGVAGELGINFGFSHVSELVDSLLPGRLASFEFQVVLDDLQQILLENDLVSKILGADGFLVVGNHVVGVDGVKEDAVSQESFELSEDISAGNGVLSSGDDVSTQGLVP